MRREFVRCANRVAALRTCPWAAVAVKVDGGYLCFESEADATAVVVHYLLAGGEEYREEAASAAESAAWSAAVSAARAARWASRSAAWSAAESAAWAAARTDFNEKVKAAGLDPKWPNQ